MTRRDHEFSVEVILSCLVCAAACVLVAWRGGLS